MEGKDFLSIADLDPEEVGRFVNKANEMRQGEKSSALDGITVALLFEKPSLRTRVSFEVGIRKLGGHCIYLSKDDVGLGEREPVSDVARVLDRWVNVIVARVFSHKSLELLAQYTTVPIINALSDLEHPCQAIGDLLTILNHKSTLEGLRVAFVGDGNNVASSLVLACSSVGAEFIHSSPTNYQVPKAIWKEAHKRAAFRGSRVSWIEFPRKAVQDADVVYTDVWASMGQEAERKDRLQTFREYQVTNELLSYAKSNAIFMHDMPAHEGEEGAQALPFNKGVAPASSRLVHTSQLEAGFSDEGDFGH